MARFMPRGKLVQDGEEISEKVAADHARNHLNDLAKEILLAMIASIPATSWKKGVDDLLVDGAFDLARKFIEKGKR